MSAACAGSAAREQSARPKASGRSMGHLPGRSDGGKVDYSVKRGRERRHVLGCRSTAARDPEDECREQDCDDAWNRMVLRELIDSVDTDEERERVASERRHPA